MAAVVQNPWIIVEISNSYVFLTELIIKISIIFFIKQLSVLRRTVTIYITAGMFGRSFPLAFIPSKLQKGFGGYIPF